MALASSNLKRFGGESWRRKIRFFQKCVSDFLLFPDANQLIDLLITFSETKISKFGIFFLFRADETDFCILPSSGIRFPK